MSIVTKPAREFDRRASPKMLARLVAAALRAQRRPINRTPSFPSVVPCSVRTAGSTPAATSKRRTLTPPMGRDRHRRHGHERLPVVHALPLCRLAQRPRTYDLPVLRQVPSDHPGIRHRDGPGRGGRPQRSWLAPVCQPGRHATELLRPGQPRSRGTEGVSSSHQKGLDKAKSHQAPQKGLFCL